LSGGYVMYFPDAFDAPSRAAIEASYPQEKRIVVTEEEATAFACNVISVRETIFMHKSSADLSCRLGRLGFDVVQVDMSEFIKGGGSAKSLVLRLSDIQLQTENAA
jgi:N-dimethylarginine dimethylaminohydrolase